MTTASMNTLDLENLPGAVRGAIEHYRISCAEFARRTGVPQPVIWKLKEGKQQHVRSDILGRMLPWLTREAPMDDAATGEAAQNDN